MTPEPFADRPVRQPGREQSLRVLQEALDRAYEHARRGGYRRGSCEMEALGRAETRYQQAKSG